MSKTDGVIKYASVPQTLTQVSGVVVRQKTQAGEAIAQSLGLPFEASNKYHVNLLPADKAVKSEPKDSKGWEPSAEDLKGLEGYMMAVEESDCCVRACFTCCGCKNLRPLKMHLAVVGETNDVYVIDRPFQCGGLCCCPLRMMLDSKENGQSKHLGRVRENFSPYFSRCASACCLATTYTDIDRALPDGEYETKYTLRTNVACCGRVNNCFGGTCLRNDAVFDILDTNGEVVAHLQKTYGRGNDCLGAFCRMGLGFNNYLLEFPPGSTAEDRALLLTALFQVEYQLFEMKDK